MQSALVAVVLWVGVTPAAPSGKLPSAVSSEMQASIVAVNKALGLESWPLHGAKPCVDRGGEGISSKDVSAEDTRRCAGAALAGGFPQLGKTYALAILMAPVGPATVMAVGLGDLVDWGAYSCDPERKCPPTKLSAPTKWGKRLQERFAKACADTSTVWFPSTAHPCP